MSQQIKKIVIGAYIACGVYFEWFLMHGLYLIAVRHQARSHALLSIGATLFALSIPPVIRQLIRLYRAV